MNKHLHISVAIWLGLLLVLGCGTGIAGQSAPPLPLNPVAGDYTQEIVVNGLKRSYLIHVPVNFNARKPIPVIIMFHGGGGTGQVAMKETGWDKKADQEGFLAVFPDGSRPDPSKRARFRGNPQTWNDGSRRQIVGAAQRHVDDIAFVNALIDDLLSRFPIDQHRIYVTGFSNGSSMAFRIGRELSNRIAAIAPASGADWLDKPLVSRPISLLYITGTDDPLNPINGGEQKVLGHMIGTKPPVREEIDKWVAMLSCPTSYHVIRDNDGVRGIAYGPCREGSEVVYYTVEGMGHTWAGGKSMLPAFMVGATSDKIKANDLIWEFFLKHPK
jgi:polyhydroxybutyrate depolymerase